MRVFARPVGCAHARSSPRVFALSTRSNSRSSSSSRVTRAAARPSERLARLTAAASKMLWKGCADPSKCATVESLVEILLPWESNSLCAPGRLIKVNTRQGTHTSSPPNLLRVFHFQTLQVVLFKLRKLICCMQKTGIYICCIDTHICIRTDFSIFQLCTVTRARASWCDRVQCQPGLCRVLMRVL